jgi:hypothetical protein
MQFVLHEVFQAEKEWSTMAATAEVNRELADTILEEGGKITANLIAPLNRPGDEEGVQWSESGVKTAAGYREAYQIYAESMWVGLGGNPDYGGQGMPKMLTTLFEEMLHSASNAFCLYSMLTSGAALALDAHGSEALKSRYLPKMYSGEWAGAMCLTESHAGTDLGMIRTKAVDQGDGSYSISGAKIFITGGEHDLTDNIIHLVLAKLPDAPAGSRGISLFLVPKVLVNDDESLGERNAVSCGSIEHKMGINASATCVMNFDGAKGYLVGELNKGLQGMFTMMNYERLLVGVQGTGCAEAAYQGALAYAKERIQSRAPSGVVSPDKEADPILVHPDVRRMLLTQKAFIEGGRAFSVYVGQQLDRAKYAEGEAAEKAEALVALLTPVAKAFLTDKGFECCVHGQQVFGGHGYIREWGMEQLVRDVRISQIYEGTNGIQALDLMGRKVVANGGKYVDLYTDEILAYCDEQSSSPAMAEFIDPLRAAVAQLRACTAFVIKQSEGRADEVGAASVEYLHLFGYVSLMYMWARSCEVALPQQELDFYRAKVMTARFYTQRLMPQILALKATVEAGADSMMAMPEALF